jgi:hypothetical protein
MLLNKIDWLLGTYIRAKVRAIEDSCSYIIRTEATGRSITYRYATEGWPDPQRL